LNGASLAINRAPNYAWVSELDFAAQTGEFDIVAVTDGVNIINSGITKIFQGLNIAGSVTVQTIAITGATFIGEIFINEPITALTTVDFSGATIVVQLELVDFSGLTSLNLSSMIQLIGGLSLSGCALPSANVNAILARLVLCTDLEGNPWAGFADFSGGTNGAPTGQGLIDKAALITRGATITTN
jgi:hypothetical protein